MSMKMRPAFAETMKLIIGNKVHKALKRKDSDAGENGRALEELRASLLSELRTSEGAKRQQQRFCSPTVALTFNFTVAVSIIMINKLLLGRVGFNYPIFLTLIHYALSWFLLASLKAFSLLPASPPAKTTPFYSLIALGIIMAFSNGLANVSLKYNSVGFYQMAKIAVTPTIVLSEFLLFGKRASIQKVLALAVVSLGVAVATVTDLQFNLFGALVSLAWIMPSAANKILWSNLQQQDNWTALALMWKTTPITIFSLVVGMPWLDPPGLLAFNWNASNILAITFSATLGFLLQWSGALALGATSATTHVVLGQFKTCVILLGSFFLFNTNPGLSSICGAIVALGAMAVYAYLNLQEKHEPRGKHIPLGQNSSFSPRSKFNKVSMDSHDLNAVYTYLNMQEKNESAGNKSPLKANSVSSPFKPNSVYSPLKPTSVSSPRSQVTKVNGESYDVNGVVESV